MRIIFGILVVAAIAAPALSDCRTPYWEPVSVLQRSAEFLATADFNDDGEMDMAANTATTIFVALNDGNGGLGAPVDVFTGSIRGSVLAAEITGDGHIDLLFASGNSLIVLPGNGDGTFASAIASATTIAPDGISVAPFDVDLDSDAAAFDPALAVLVIFTNDGAGNFTERTRISLRTEARALVTGDFDGDARTDVVVGYSWTAMDAFYGRSDSAFDSGTILGTGAIASMHPADMNGDGLLDLTWVRSPFDHVVVTRNLGSRSFGDPLSFPVPASGRDHAADDLTGDGAPDVIATGQGCAIWTLTGTGLGTLFPQRVTGANAIGCDPNAGGDVVTGDFDGDGRTDAVVSAVTFEHFNTPSVTLLRNLCGDGRIILSAQPLISIGQSVTIFANVRAPLGTDSPIIATGSVSIREGDTTLATGTLTSSATVAIPVSGLALGAHSLVVVYGGDAQYEPIEEPITITVTNETTTIAFEATPTPGVHGKRAFITATVTSSTGDTPTGPLTLSVQEWNGSNVVNTTAPTATIEGPFAAGSWTFIARFAGDATHPPSSATMTYVVGKATPTIVFNAASAPEGQTTSVSVAVSPPDFTQSAFPTGTVTIREGGVTFGTFGLFAEFNLPILPVGRHFFHITYNGDSNYNTAEIDAAFIVFPTGQQSIDARGTTDAVRVTWWTDLPFLRRKTADQSWAQATGGGCCSQAPWNDTSALPETVYLYRMQGPDGSFSNADLGMRISFTDDPLKPGTKIKAVHLQEIVRAANIVRSAAHLSAFTHSATPGSPVITAAQLNALRDAINTARVSLGATPFSFTNVIAPQTPIRAADVQELREAIR